VAVLQSTISIMGSNVLFEVTVNDSDSNAEFDAFTFQISGNVAGLSNTVLESAIHAFANTIAATKETFYVQGIKKTQASETTI
jgi:hypothetical protein